MNKIAYGPLEGRYFTQWRIDLLHELTERLEEIGVEMINAEIWYDDPEDYHCLRFTSNGKSVFVRFYKVFTYYLDGKVKWQGCLRSRMYEFANSIKNAVNDG